MRRTTLILAWTAAAFFVWAKVASLAVGVIYRLVTRPLALPLGEMLKVSVWLWYGGMILAPAAVALLGMRGKLPGTSSGPRPAPRGFDVTPPDVAAG